MGGQLPVFSQPGCICVCVSAEHTKFNPSLTCGQFLSIKFYRSIETNVVIINQIQMSIINITVFINFSLYVCFPLPSPCHCLCRVYTCFQCVHVCVCPSSNVVVLGFMGVYVLVRLRHVFSNPSGVHPHACLFVFSVFALASLMLSSYSLAATGQLINQIFKQCFSAQWVVLDYLWLLAVHGAATL